MATSRLIRYWNLKRAVRHVPDRSPSDLTYPWARQLPGKIRKASKADRPGQEGIELQGRPPHEKKI